MAFDGVRYLCCQDCGGFVVEGEAQAHACSCNGALVCRVCGERVPVAGLRDHLAAHNPQAVHLEPDAVRDQFTADPEPEMGDFLGCLTGTIRFGPGWDGPLPPEDWEALADAGPMTRAHFVVLVQENRAPGVLGPMSPEARQALLPELVARYGAGAGVYTLDMVADGPERLSAAVKRYKREG